MAGDGLREVLDPTRAFLGDDHAEAPGVAVAAILEGSRPLLVEVQALVAPAGHRVHHAGRWPGSTAAGSRSSSRCSRDGLAST